MLYQSLKLDTFQEQAVRDIDNGLSLLVAAPTGCGKTLIAEYAVDVSMRLKKRIIYTAPIKALSNQKYRDFKGRFGPDAVGIHTGDVTINPDAPLLIMTTEIFRNMILEQSRRLDHVYYVIFDEIHFLDDIDRGTVWEECIILAPRETRFLCLSATVPNIEELAHWMGTVRETTISVIKEQRRPVPLHHGLFSEKYGALTLRQVRKRFRKNPAQRKKFFRRRRTCRRIIGELLNHKQIPMLYFCFNRGACERYAEQHQHLHLLSQPETKRATTMVDELVDQYKLHHYQRLPFLRKLWVSGCGFHHAGLLPSAKEIVEQLFTAGRIKLLFCTETFALGINMPARSVVFDELEKFDGVDFSYLMTRHYNQMAGRAGRRGIDEAGFVYSHIIPEATDPRQIERLWYGKNEHITSKFKASYATILNLYSRYGEDAFGIFRSSFRNFRKGSFTATKSYRREEAQIRARIAFLQAAGFLNGTVLTDKGLLAAAVNGYEIQAAELYAKGGFQDLSSRYLVVVLASLVTEPSRKNRDRPAVSDSLLTFDAVKIIKKLRKMERKYNIADPIRDVDFSLAAPVFAWAGGCSLRELGSFGVPEGDLVRLLRMTIQLLRTLSEKLPDPVLADAMYEAMGLINRDVVDAQAELEVAGVGSPDSMEENDPSTSYTTL